MKKSCALLWLLYEVLVFIIILHTIRMLICIIQAILPTPLPIAMQGKKGSIASNETKCWNQIFKCFNQQSLIFKKQNFLMLKF